MMQNELHIYLTQYFGLPADQLEEVAELFDVEHLDKNDPYLREGQQCNKMSFIKDGIMRIHALWDGKEITQWISTKGYFITDISSFMFKSPAFWNIDALTNTTLYTIRDKNYQRLHTTIPNWSKLELQFMSHCFATIERRVFHQLSMSAEQRYTNFYNQNKELFNQVPLQYIASMLGMTPETLSRLRQKKIT